MWSRRKDISGKVLRLFKYGLSGWKKLVEGLKQENLNDADNICKNNWKCAALERPPFCVRWIFKIHLKFHSYNLWRVMDPTGWGLSTLFPKTLWRFSKYVLFERWCRITSVITRFENVWLMFVKLLKKKCSQIAPTPKDNQEFGLLNKS